MKSIGLKKKTQEPLFDRRGGCHLGPLLGFAIGFRNAIDIIDSKLRLSRQARSSICAVFSHYSRLHWSPVNGKFDAIPMLLELDGSGADVALRFTSSTHSLQRRDLLIGSNLVPGVEIATRCSKSPKHQKHTNALYDAALPYLPMEISIDSRIIDTREELTKDHEQKYSGWLPKRWALGDC